MEDNKSIELKIKPILETNIETKSNFETSHPGLFLQGPDEKYALEGLILGLLII